MNYARVPRVTAKLAWWVALAVGCSDPSPPAPVGSATSASAPASSSVTEKERDAVVAFFADVGERSAAAMKKVGDTKPKSKLAYAEALALVTPAAFPSHTDLFEKHGLDLDRFTVAMSDPAVEARALAALRSKIEPVQAALLTQDLPEVDPDDCTALARRLIELREAGPSKVALGGTLAPSFVPCATVVPRHVGACLPSPAKPATVAAFDACVAAGQKKP